MSPPTVPPALRIDPAFEALLEGSRISHAVTTRSAGDLLSAAGLAALARGLGVDRADFVRARQVHGARVLEVPAGASGIVGGDEGADGLVTSAEGICLLTLVADCAPVALADPVSGAIAAVHAGWRGAVAGIAGEAVRALTRRLGADEARLCALIGPAIQPCCFEVGPEVAEAAAARPGGLAATVRRDAWPRPHLDLPALVRADLEAAGVGPGRIVAAPECTRCGGGYFSYRGDGTAKRFGLAIVRRP